MKVIYVGPHTAVDVPVPAGALALPEHVRDVDGVVTVAHGDELDTTRDHAELLLEQKDNWRPVKQAAKKGGDS